jgi:D-threo-aldose 1-dehydrogenase
MSGTYWPVAEGVAALGFGCAGLYAGPDLAASVRRVERAVELGLRHFDVAPSYGLGTAETVIGAALGRRRDQVTLTTKVGLRRPGALAVWARAAAAPLRWAAPAVTRPLGARVYAGATGGARFDLAFLRRSFEVSLRRMRTDHVDLLLLHEARPDDLSDDVVCWLHDQRASGRALRVGVGIADGVAAAGALAAAKPDDFDVLQFGWSALEATPAAWPSPSVILHGAVSRALPGLPRRLLEPAGLARLSERLGVDLATADAMGDLLLAAGLAANPGGVVIAATRDSGRLARRAAIAVSPKWLDAGARLPALLKAELAGQSSGDGERA